MPTFSSFTHPKLPSHTDKYLNFVIDIPFRVSDPNRFLRFQAYVLEKECQLVSFDVPNNMMTGSMLRVENAEFDKLYKLNKMTLESSGATVKGDRYSKSVYTSEMKNQSADDVQRKIDLLQKGRREERDWQPAQLLLARCGLRDPHENKKVKPPMYFKGSESKKGYTEFEKRETLN